jgi:hypothetical protein
MLSPTQATSRGAARARVAGIPKRTKATARLVNGGDLMMTS